MERIRVYLLFLRDLLLVPLVLLMHSNKRKMIFGAWSGHQYSCNPKHLFEYMVKRGGFDCYWIGDAELEMRVTELRGAKFIKKGSVRAFWHCLTATMYVSNVQWRSDIINLPTCGRVKLIYTTHGMPDKKMGQYQLNGNGISVKDLTNNTKHGIRMCVRSCIERIDSWLYDQRSWGSFSSPESRDLYIINFSGRLSQERSICEGTPRGDYMIKASNNEELRKSIKRKYAELLGLAEDKKWWIFVPTWRHDKEYLFSFSTSKHFCEYAKLLESQNAILIEKQHPITLETLGIEGGNYGNLTVVSSKQARKIELQELLVACDRLITDYSSVYYDFVLMNRPVLHFTYDYDHFMTKDMGFCFDIREYGGGPFSYTEAELLKFLALDDQKLLSLRNAKTSVQLSCETGRSCEGYYNLFLRLSSKRSDFMS